MRLPLVLCYHAVSSSWPAPLAVSAESFGRHVELLASRGYVGLTLVEAERRRARGDLPPRAVVFTFDDGYTSTLHAKPALDRVGFPATLFVVTSFVESGEPLRWPGIDHWGESPHAAELEPLGWSQLEELVDAGWEIGSHTIGHPKLPTVGDDQLAEELGASRAAIVSRLGRCETIAYPYGLADERVAAATDRAGYLAGCCLTSLHRVDTPFLRPRVGIYRGDAGWRLRLKLSPQFNALRRTDLFGATLRLRERLARA